MKPGQQFIHFCILFLLFRFQMLPVQKSGHVGLELVVIFEAHVDGVPSGVSLLSSEYQLIDVHSLEVLLVLSISHSSHLVSHGQEELSVLVAESDQLVEALVEVEGSDVDTKTTLVTSLQQVLDHGGELP